MAQQQPPCNTVLQYYGVPVLDSLVEAVQAAMCERTAPSTINALVHAVMVASYENIAPNTITAIVERAAWSFISMPVPSRIRRLQARPRPRPSEGKTRRR